MNKQVNQGSYRPISQSEVNLEKLTGEIVDWDRKKVYHKNQFHGNTYYKLKVISKERQNKEENIFVYSNLVSPQIFTDIEQEKYVKKKYLFFCGKIKKAWILHHWQELTNHEKT